MQHFKEYKHFYFIGIGGAGMSALALYLVTAGKKVTGSDRQFGDLPSDTQKKLQAENVICVPQDGSGIDATVDVVIVSTAIESSVADVKTALQKNIPILKRSELLAQIAQSKKTVAIGGTSGKSTTAAMLYHILDYAQLQPSVITGAGLTSLIKQGKIGNAHYGAGDWLVIEADESDGSIVQYQPALGVLLNIDKDHQDIGELENLFTIFRNNSEAFICNKSHPLSATLSNNNAYDFGMNSCYAATDIVSADFKLEFKIEGYVFNLNMPGRHNVENAEAAVAAAAYIGVSIPMAADALKSFEGIYRRHQIIGKHKGVLFVDDYAHNPAKCAASINAMQSNDNRLIAWFQPHGYKPTYFLKDEFIQEIAKALRSHDLIIMSEIYYAGGSAEKNISAAELVAGINAAGGQALFIENRQNIIPFLNSNAKAGDTVLFMGARDPSLEQFTKQVVKEYVTN